MTRSDQTPATDRTSVDRRSLIAGGSAAGIAALTLPRAANAASPGAGGVNVDAPSGVANWVVDDDGVVGTNGVTHLTIQEAVTAANPGDIIEVRAGTYTGTVTISKANLTIRGPQAGVTGTQTAGRANGLGEAVVQTASSGPAFSVESAGTGFTLNGLTLANATSANLDGVYLNGAIGATITCCRFIGGGDISVPPTTTALVGTYNAFENTGGRGVHMTTSYVRTTPCQVEIRRNWFEGWHTAVVNQSSNGFVVSQNHFFRNRTVNSNDDVVNASYTNNTYTENYRCVAGAGKSATPSNFTVQDNTFINNVRGVNIGDAFTSAVITENSFEPADPNVSPFTDPIWEGHVTTGINQNTGTSVSPPINVENNYWGQASGPASGALRRFETAWTNSNSIDPNSFDFTPWCTNSACTAFASS